MKFGRSARIESTTSIARMTEEERSRWAVRWSLDSMKRGYETKTMGKRLLSSNRMGTRSAAQSSKAATEHLMEERPKEEYLTEERWKDHL